MPWVAALWVKEVTPARFVIPLFVTSFDDVIRKRLGEGCVTGGLFAERSRCKQKRRRAPASFVGSEQVSELFPRFESDGVPGRDLHLDSRLRVSSDPLLALLDLKNAKPSELDALPARERG